MLVMVYVGQPKSNYHKNPQSGLTDQITPRRGTLQLDKV